MSDQSSLQDTPQATDANRVRNSPNTGRVASSSSALPSSPDSPETAQIISYIPHDSNASSPLQNRKNGHQDASSSPPDRPCGPCYTREELLHLRKSPLVAPPAGMPARKDWYGEYNEQPSKPKDHDGLAASRTRHRRDADSDDPTRSFDSTRPSFKSGPAQPSQMGSFRHQSRSEIDKDTASLKSMAERYDRGERLPSTITSLGRVKDRETIQHLASVTPRIGAVPRRAEGREPRQRKLGDDTNDWRKGADPAREREPRGGAESTRNRDPSRSRGGGGDNEGTGERRRRDKSRDDESRRWREDNANGNGNGTTREKDRRAREPSSTREERGGRKRGEDDERAEANRRRKEERDKETPAWFDDDIPSAGGAKGIVGAKVGDELDELQKWKLEKKAREEQKERDEREATSTQSFDNDETNYRESNENNMDEHKTPRPSNVHPDLLPAAAPPPLPTANANADPSPLDHLKALMGMPKNEMPSQPGFGDSTAMPTSFANAAARSQSSSAINYDAMAKASSEDARRVVDYDPPAVSRHAFAQPRTNPSPSPTDTTGFGHNPKFIDPASQQNGYGPLAGPPGLRPVQSAEPSRRTRNLSDLHALAASQLQRSSQNASPADSHGSNDRAGFMNRQPPPHMNGGYESNNAAPLLHLPMSSGPGAGPRDGSMNVLSVAAPQPQPSGINMAGMPGMGGGPHRGTNESPQQNLLARLGILTNQERKPSPKTMDGPGGGGFERPGMNTDLRMPMPQQNYGSGPPSAMSRSAYGSPVDERFEPMGQTDGRYSMNHSQAPSSNSSNFGPSPVGGNNPAQNLSAKGSRLAKFFENPRGGAGGEDMVSPASMHSSGMGSMDGSMSGRGGIVTPPYQFDNNKNQGMPDLLALLQGSNLHGSQSQNGMNPAQQSMYRDEMVARRQRELALQQQQQQLRERDARLEQQMYGQNQDLFDSRGSFVSNDLVPGLRPPIQRPERELYNPERLDERLVYAAQGRVPGVPGNYDQMMRNMNTNAPIRGGNMYTGIGGASGGVGGMPNHLSAELLQQQQLQQQRERERQRQLQRQEIERAQQLLAMQGNAMGGRNPANNLAAQLGPRQNSVGVDQYNRGGGGRIPMNDIQSQQFGGYGGMGGGPGGMNVNGGYGGINAGNNQLNGFDLPIRQQQQQQQQLGLQQQRQANLGMAGYGGLGGVEPRYSQQNQMHVGGMHGQGGNQPPDLMALLLAGNHNNQQN
ncbi:hypothetical protein M408DRAFT_6159 [Serendipita vermifera MAFF 305830]|uniref:Uncharacterized protein n=1 Tax=Serendipita vermifera MAFF 305830 TaxID=933852 RepID=A0A0C2XUV6_SERVB|nr:hypothetical protein M408DRAFT_6159 [Serendipita vermifera MAFF 305830]